MLKYALLCLLAVAVSCDEYYGWKYGNRYEYEHITNSFLGFNGYSSSYKTNVTIVPLSSDKLSVTIRFIEFLASTGNDLKDATLSAELTSRMSAMFSGKPFEVKLKKGIVTGLIVSQDVYSQNKVELSFNKGFASHIQLDLQSECDNQEPCPTPKDINPKSAYKTRENATIGACETQYGVVPLSEHSFEVVKTTDLLKCIENSTYRLDYDPERRLSDKKLSKIVSNTETNRIVVSGNIKQYIIQSIVSTTKTVFQPQTPLNLGSTIILVNNATLTSTQPAEGHLRNVSDPQEVDLTVNVNDLSDVLG